MAQWLRICLPVQRIFTTQGLNPGLPYCRQILYRLSPQGSPHHINPARKHQDSAEFTPFMATVLGHPEPPFRAETPVPPAAGSLGNSRSTTGRWQEGQRPDLIVPIQDDSEWPSRLPSSDLRATWGYITIHLLLSTNPLKRTLRRHGLPAHFLHINLHIRVCFLWEQIKSRVFPDALLTWTSNCLSCLNTYTHVIHFSPVDYVVSYHFTCLCVLSNHVRAGLKEDCVSIFSAVLANQFIALNFRVLESFLKVVLEWSCSRESARAGTGEPNGGQVDGGRMDLELEVTVRTSVRESLL